VDDAGVEDWPEADNCLKTQLKMNRNDVKRACIYKGNREGNKWNDPRKQ